MAPEPAVGAEPWLDKGFELDDETVGALVSGGDNTDVRATAQATRTAASQVDESQRPHFHAMLS